MIFEEAQVFLTGHFAAYEDSDGTEWTGGGTGGDGDTDAGGTYDTLLVDGQWGPVTSRAFQIVLHDKGFYTGLIDLDFGSVSVKALQSSLTASNYYSGLIDGDFGPRTSPGPAEPTL